MSLTPAFVAVLIAALSLLVSLLNLIYTRRDKSAEALQKSLDRMGQQMVASIGEQKSALAVVDQTVHRRIDDLTTTTSTWQAQTVMRLTSIDTSQSAIDERLKHILVHRDLEALQRTIGEVAVSVGRLGGQLDTNTRMTERINNFLMEQGK